MAQQMTQGEYDAFVSKYGKPVADAAGLFVAPPPKGAVNGESAEQYLRRGIFQEAQIEIDNLLKGGAVGLGLDLPDADRRAILERFIPLLKTDADYGKSRDEIVKKYSDLAQQAIGLKFQEKVSQDIDKQLNPAKYLDQAKKDENISTARRLLQQNYGEETNDPDLEQFLADRLAEGESAFEVSQFLQTTPQYMKKQADIENQRVQTESTAAREALNQELLRSQQQVFERAQPSIISSFMRAGRLGSSGLNSALAKAQADLEKERQSFIGNAAYNDAIRAQGYRREDFVSGNNAAFQQYLRQNEPAYQQKFNVQNAGNYANFQQPWDALNRSYQLSDQARQRQYEVEDYNRQQSDYNRYMSEQRKSDRQNLPWQLLGQLGGAGIQAWGMRK